MKRIPLAALWAALSFSALFAQGQLLPNSWTTGTPMPTARMGPYTGVIGNNIYVAGGELANNTAVTVNEVYNTVTNTWTSAAPLPSARFNGASAVVNNIFYAIGGQTISSGILTSVEAYDPVADQWTAKSPMPTAIDSMYAVVAGNIIYVVGGYNGNRIATVLAYDPAADKWSTAAPLKTAKSQSALGVFGSIIVSAGGLLASNNASTDVEGYNTATNTWTALAPLPSGRQAGCFESAGNMLFFAGGHDINFGSPVTTMDAYHSDTNMWETGLPQMPYAAVNMGSANLGGRLYCFGGTNGTTSGLNVYNYVQIYQPDLPPSISAQGVVSASAFGQFTSIAPGSWIEIYGANLSATTRGWTLADFSGINAPTSLDGVKVTIGGEPAFIDYISPGQINALVPSGIPTGAQQIIVTNTAGTSAAYNINVNAVEPGILAPPSFNINGVAYAVAIFTDGAYALPTGAIAGVNSRPAKPGDVVTLYGVGFGPVTPSIPAGQLVQQTNMLSLPLQLSIGGVPAQVLYDGLAPDFTGLYQLNVMVPSAAPGNAALTFTLNGVSGTQTLTIALGQ